MASRTIRKLLRSEEVAVPATVIVAAVKSTAPVGVRRNPKSTASLVFAATLPAPGAPALSIATRAAMVMALPVAVPLSSPVLETWFVWAMLPVKVLPTVAPAATSATSR